MTRRVNFSADQRVDLPEIQALQQFLTEDDRRFVRMCLLGKAQSENRVIRGFKVEPEAPVSARVLVIHDLGAPGESAFMGAENLGGIFEHGALAGGIDGAGNLEGAAQLLLDFSAQPAATYDVKVRLTFTTGIADNRAFWNPSTDQEVVRQTDTRKLPQWQIAFQGHADPDWVLLASVVWNGVSIAAADITDKRQFAIEGMANPTGAAPWSHAAQDETTGVGDFPRGDLRDDPTVGTFGVWEALTALARQIQDLKGQREGDQRFDWYSRVFAPPGFRTGAVPKPDEYTKSLRSIDTVTFTVADGSTEGADFTGANALVNCFKFIQDNAAELPGRILVVVKDRQAPGPWVYNWDQNIVIPDKHIGLIGVQGGTVSAATPTLFQVGEGQIAIGMSTALDTVALKMTGKGGLYCENLVFYDDVEGGAQLSLIEVDPRGYFQGRNVTITVNASPNEARPQLRCGSERLVLDECRLNGCFFIGGRSATAFPINADPDNFHTGGVVQRSTIQGLLRLRNKLAPVIGEELLYAYGVKFERTTFVPSTVMAREFGQIDARGTRQLGFDDCQFSYWGDQDCLRFGDMDLGGVFVTSRDSRVHDSRFKMQFSAAHAGFIGGAGGVNGVQGTGWAIKIQPTGVVSVRTQIPKNIRVTHNRFTPDISLALLDTSPDAGCVSCVDAREVRIEKNDVREWTMPLASVGDSQILFYAAASFAGALVGGGQVLWINDNFVGDWRELAVGQAWGAVGQFLNCLRIGPFVNGCKVHNNTISAVDETGSTIDPSGAHSAVVVFDSLDIDFARNRFVGWRSLTDPTDSTCVGGGGILFDLRFSDNNFIACGGNNLDVIPGSVLVGFHASDNKFNTGTDKTKFSRAIRLPDASEHVHIRDNEWDYVAAFPADVVVAVYLGAPVHFTVVGNYFDHGDISHLTAAGAPTATSFGYAEPGQNLNYVFAYV